MNNWDMLSFWARCAALIAATAFIATMVVLPLSMAWNAYAEGEDRNAYMETAQYSKRARPTHTDYFVAMPSPKLTLVYTNVSIITLPNSRAYICKFTDEQWAELCEHFEPEVGMDVHIPVYEKEDE